MRTRLATLLAFFALNASALAQDQPLSVIDWLKRNPNQPAMTSAVIPPRFEPPVAPGVIVPKVVVKPLDQSARRFIGLVPSSVTGLPETLWSGSVAEDAAAQIRDAPVFRLPAAKALLYTLLLTEASGPGTTAEGDDLLTLARVETLMKLGAHDPAISLLEQADVTRDSAHFAAFMDAALLTGLEDTACGILVPKPYLAPSLTHSAFCAARQGDWPTAALIFDTGRTLGAIPPEDAAVLERFLHAEAYEDAPPLPRPKEMTPMLFRLYEAVGEPLPTGTLPRRYAVADLRDLAGWKPQLDAAERLAATGAISPNRLLGLYTARAPAASGGVWDRVQAVQRFDTALRTRSADAISKTLPPAWHLMEAAGLDIIFAELFADALKRYRLTGDAAQIAWQMSLLSASYREADRYAQIPPELRALAVGEPEPLQSNDTRMNAIVAGFDRENARADLVAMARNGRMGEAILKALVLLDNGAGGDPVALTQGLATLRTFGMEDTVRRAALQIALLDRYRR